MIQSPILKLQPGCNWFRVEISSPPSYWTLCATAVRMIFDVPKTTKQIQFQLFKKPGKDRVPVDFINSGNRYDCIIDGGDSEFIITPTRNALDAKGFKAGTWYVKCFYWE